jgi:hypothetical protein
VVSPMPMPKVCLQAATISSEPLNQHGVVVQIWIRNIKVRYGFLQFITKHRFND